MESDRQRKCSEASDATRQRSDPSSFDSLMLLGVCTLTLVPQRAFITQHRGRRRQHAVSMEAVSAPQAPPQTVSTDEQHAAFEAIIDRCENFAEDFDGFLRVAEDLREVFDADFQQYQSELRAAATSQNASPLRLQRAGSAFSQLSLPRPLSVTERAPGCPRLQLARQLVGPRRPALYRPRYRHLPLPLTLTLTLTQVTCMRPTDGLHGVMERLEAGAPEFRAHILAQRQGKPARLLIRVRQAARAQPTTPPHSYEQARRSEATG